MVCTQSLNKKSEFSRTFYVVGVTRLELATHARPVVVHVFYA